MLNVNVEERKLDLKSAQLFFAGALRSWNKAKERKVKYAKQEEFFRQQAEYYQDQVNKDKNYLRAAGVDID